MRNGKGKRNFPSKNFKKRPKASSVLDVFSSDDEKGNGDLNAAYGDSEGRSGSGGKGNNTDFLINDVIDPEDDEEIEEDDAFNDSDDEKYGDLFPSENDEDEEEMEDEYSLGQDDDAEDDEDDEVDCGKTGAFLSDLLDGSAPEEDFSEDEDDDDESSDEENSNNLKAIVRSVTSKGHSDAVSIKGKKKSDFNIKNEQTEVYQESEFHVGSSRARNQDGEDKNQLLGLSDLLSSFENSDKFGSLKKKLERLDTVGLKDAVGGAVPAPLPRRTQEKVSRKAAKEIVTKEVGKWLPIVQKHKKAEHVTFPLNDPGKLSVSSASLLSKFEPKNDMELAIAKALEESGMSEKQIREGEELEMQNLSVEEVKARRAELAKMRSLLFYEEQKMKRISKIKSKTYRKIKKREKLRKAALEAENDPVSREEALEARSKLESERALARMTLKSQKMGKWAQQMIHSNSLESMSRQEINEHLNRVENLKRKIQGLDSDEEDVESEDAEDFNDDNDNGDGSEPSSKRALLSLEKEIMESEELQQNQGGVFAMKFMRDAVQKQKQRVLEAIQDDLDQENGQEDDDEKSVSSTSNNMDLDQKKGRINFVGACKTSSSEGKGELTAFESLRSKSFTTKTNVPIDLSSSELREKSMVFEVEPFPQDSVNLTLSNAFDDDCMPSIPESFSQSSDESGVNPLHDNEEVDDDEEKEEDEDDLDGSNPWIKESNNSKPLQKSFKQTIDQPLLAKQTKLIRKKQECNDQVSNAIQFNEDDEDDNGKEEDESDKEEILLNPSSTSFSKQRELIERAFANDNVVQEEFEAEKAAIVAAEAPRVEDLTMPGWGGWGGASIPVRKNKVVRHVPGLDPTARKDSNVKHAIINEKKLKIPEKFQVKSIPHGFESRQQYERTLDLPLGKEWNTTTTFQKLVKPRIITKSGRVIEPPKLPRSNYKKNNK